MNQSKPDGSSQDPVTKLLDTLTPEQQEALRRKLNEKAWSKQFQQAYDALKNPADRLQSNSIGQKSAAAFQHLIDRLASGDIDEDIKQTTRTIWQGLQQSLQSLPEKEAVGSVRSEDPQIALEQAYQDDQSNLIEARQAAAQAIATEKQLEQQVQKNKEQAATWQNRADMAAQQNNEDLCNQAMQRSQQYAEAAVALENELKLQRDALVQLRKELTKFEGEVQRFYTQKQLLVTRDKVATATAKANAILSKTNPSGALATIERMERKIAEKESKASALNELTDNAISTEVSDINTMLAKAVAGIDRLNSVVERMEQKVAEHESQARLG